MHIDVENCHNLFMMGNDSAPRAGTGSKASSGKQPGAEWDRITIQSNEAE